MAMIRMATRADMDGANDRSITVTCSTETLGRDDIVLMSDGIDLAAYRTNPVVLFQHNPDWPVARAEEIGVVDGALVARVRFPAEGVSARSDEVYGLIRAGVINAASTGFDTRDAEPLDPTNPRDGLRITACELQEFSFVSIPAVPDALITERAMQEAHDRMARNTPVEDTRISALKAGITKRGLYEVGRLACLLDELGWTKSSAEWEADIEQDGSTVPAQLGEALKALGAVLVAMTTEEVAELVGGADPEVAELADEEETELVQQAATPALARFRLGRHRARFARRAAPLPADPTRSTTIYRRMANLYRLELAAAE